MAQIQAYQANFIPNIGFRREYFNNAAARQALNNALLTYYWNARSLDTAQYVLPPTGWLQLQTQPQGAAPGAILLNCGGIDNGGNYGVDYVEQAFYTALPKPNYNLAHVGLPNGQITFNVSHDPTPKVVSVQMLPDGTTVSYQQDYYVMTCVATTINYTQGHPFYSYWDHLVHTQQLGPLRGNMPYQIIVNFHLYVGDPEQVQQQPLGAITLANFMPH